MPDGWAAARLEELPLAAEGEPGVAWYPLQHLFGLTAFGVNVFVAEAEGDVLVEEHDERQSGQEELYVVARGLAEFVLAGASITAPAVSVVVVRDPAVTRRALAREAGTTLVALGGPPNEEFRSTWRSEHFAGVLRSL